MHKTHVMLHDAWRLQKRRQQFWAKQIEIAQQNSIPVLAVEPGANERGIGIDQWPGAAAGPARPNTTFITAFKLQSPVHRFSAWADEAVGTQMGCIAAQYLDVVAPFLQAPDEISDGAAVAAQLLGGRGW